MSDEARRLEARIRRDPRRRAEWLRQDQLIYGGLIAGSVALVQPFLAATELDLASTIAAVSFSVAIPLLAALLMIGEQEAFRRRPAGLRVVSITKAVGQGAAVLGVAAAFWHMSWLAGVGLLASGLIGVLVHAAGWSRLEGVDVPPRAG